MADNKNKDKKTSKPAKKAPQEKSDPAQAELVSLAEVATMLRLPPLRIRKMAQSGQIPAVKVDGEWRFNKDLVYQAIKNRSRGG
ncbi:MAG: helix-turn-helix domain-containing protein [Deltaproteobacteria bacterium]|nr:helix-turn-helix domain-containing protein [Deltaproteobacteria bacterium]MBW1870644.1 helix-turn-helix domain-containing protein [Deltaproteobacteria bacterium]